jgi:hypothetical protein
MGVGAGVLGCHADVRSDTTGHPGAGGVCAQAWSMIANRDFRAWNGLPEACEYAQLASAFASVEETHGQFRLGRNAVPTRFRGHSAQGYPDNFTVWVRGERIVLINAPRPSMPYATSELLAHLGTPEMIRDYQLGVVSPVREGAWIYSTRGLALFLEAPAGPDSNVARIGLFHACSAADYLEAIDPDARVEEKGATAPPPAPAPAAPDAGE